MADTRPQGSIEKWVVEKKLRRLSGKCIRWKAKVRLSWGGQFEVDGASEDKSVVICVSTSRPRTSGLNRASGKDNKIRSDALYLLNTEGAVRRVLAFTDRDMFEHFVSDRRRGRFPSAEEIELRYVALPPQVKRKLKAAQELASREVGGR